MGLVPMILRIMFALLKPQFSAILPPQQQRSNPSMFTQRHFNFLAEVLRNTKPLGTGSLEAMWQWKKGRDTLMSALQAHNPRFNWDKLLEATDHPDGQDKA
jgi:hypothetical protein